MIRVTFLILVLYSVINTHYLSVTAGAADNDFNEIKDWQLISSSVTTAASPGVKTYMKAFPGTQLSAFRGVATLDIHISEAMGIFCNFNLSYEWVAMLESLTKYTIVSLTY
jgi:hypothetical protein